MRVLNRTAPLLAMVLALSCVDVAPPTAAIGPAGATATHMILPNSATHVVKAALPTPRYLAGGAALDGKLYVIGGRTANFAVSNVVERYDPATDSWTTLAPLPEAEVAYTASIGNWIYARTRTGGFYRYNPGTNSWQTLPSDEYGYAGAAASSGRFFYYVGGFNGSAAATTRFARYDTLTNAWTTLAPIPVPLVNISAARAGKYFVVTGGMDLTDGGFPFANEAWFSYDITTGTWGGPETSFSPGTPVLGAVADNVYSFGVGVSTVWGVDLSSRYLGQWRGVDDIPGGGPNLGAGAAIGNVFHVVSGVDLGGNVVGTHYAITVAFAGNHVPVAALGGPWNGREGAPVQLDATGSIDLDDENVLYHWNFGDGTTATTDNGAPEHTYANNGTYKVSLALTDESGKSSSRVWSAVTVRNVAPEIAPMSTDTVIRGESANVIVGISDPGTNDAHSLKFEHSDGRATSTVAGPVDETSTYQFPMLKGGTYSIKVTAKDADGGVGVGTKRIRVFTYVDALNCLRNWVDATLSVEDRAGVDRLLTLARDHAAAGHNETAANRISSFELAVNGLFVANKVDAPHFVLFNTFAQRIADQLVPTP